MKYNDPDGEVWWLAAALIGGAINVAMNIDNIDNGWDFLGYFGVGAASAAVGVLGYGVGSAIAGKFVVGGFVSGAISGLTGGLSSGFVLGGGNSLVTNGNFDGFFENAIQGAFIGGVTGAVIGGVVGGYSAYKQGNNFWTGKPNSIAPQVELNYEEMDKLAPKYTHAENTSQNSFIETTIKENLQSAKYDIFYNTNETTQFSPEGISNNIQRPIIKGYNELQLSKPGHQDLYHNFPRAIDDLVIQHGYVYPSSNGGTMYTLPGHINGAAGVYGIKINNMGIIYHRQFVPLGKIKGIY